MNFARQLLLTTQYVPALRDRVLGLIIERCLEIDVEIKIEDSGTERDLLQPCTGSTCAGDREEGSWDLCPRGSCEPTRCVD